MGFFDMKAICAACGETVGLNRYRIANKEWICPKCFKKCGFGVSTPIRTKTAAEIKKRITAVEQNSEELQTFTATKKISTYLEIDENQQKWLIPDGLFGGVKKAIVYSYKDIIDFELLEDGESINKGGLGRALVGGALFGGVGAIVGGVTGGKKSKGVCTSLKIKITLNNMSNPLVYINFITTSTKKDSFIYKSGYSAAQECLSSLQLICDTVSANNSASNADATVTPLSNADEILKYKNLLDSGIITLEEFEMKKRQLLNL